MAIKCIFVINCSSKASCRRCRLICCIYSALAGFSIPTQRALIMITIFTLAIINRRYLPAGLELYALLNILILHPLAVLNLGSGYHLLQLVSFFM